LAAFFYSDQELNEIRKRAEAECKTNHFKLLSSPYYNSRGAAVTESRQIAFYL